MGKITETRQLYKNTINEITKTEENWLSFLETAAWNFKYDFDDQVLIYAQRPNATACAEMSVWNEKVHRWINKNADGIFVFSKDENSKYPFRLVFDVTDTHNYRGTEYKLWSVKPEYEQEIIETLESIFGAESQKNTISQSITLNTYNMVIDNIQDYMSSIKKYKAGSGLENILDDELEKVLIPIIWSSVSYMMMTRCGIDAKKEIDIQEFSYINKFDSYKIITILGTAISDIAEQGLREIAKTVANLQRNEKNKNHTFLKNEKQEYYNNKEFEKGGIENGENRIYESRGLQYTKSSNETGENAKWKIRKNEVELSKRTSESRIHNFEDRGQFSRTSITDSNTSDRNDRENNTEISTTGQYERRIEDERSNEVDRSNEQLQGSSRGTSDDGLNLQLNLLTEDEQKQNIAEAENAPAFFEPLNTFYFPQDVIDNILQDGNIVENGKFKIYHHLIQGLPTDENIKFLKNEYGIGGFSKDGISINFNAKGIHLKESELSKMTLSWQTVEKRLQELISMDRYFSEYEKEQYDDWLDANEIPSNNNYENIVKDEDYKLAERLNNFIKDYDLYSYMNNVPMENTDIDNIELILADINDSENINEYINFLKSTLEDSTSDEEFTKETKSLIAELENKLPSYEFMVGDTVYIGIDEYEIRAIDDEKVTLTDIRFPLMTKEMPRDVFEDRVKDNSANDRLRKENKQETINKIPINDRENFSIETRKDELENFIGKEENLVDRLHKFLNEYDIYDVDEVTLDEVKDTLNDKQKILDTVNYFYEILDSEDYNDEIGIKLNSFIKELSELYESKDKEQTEILQESKEEKIKVNVKKKRRNKIEYFDLHPEISLKDRNNYRIDNNGLGEGTTKQKFRWNIEAIKVLKQVTQENRYATPQEQEILSQYVGWGGLADAFDSRKDNWANEYKELKELLTEKEYEEARTSSLTAFYTPPIVINSIYKALEKMGLEKGNILEPSCRHRKLYGNATK